MKEAAHHSDAASPRRRGRSTVALTAGFFGTALLSLGTDQILHLLHVYRPWGQPMLDPWLNALALAYRIVFTIFGGYLAARLAPRNPMRHAVILGIIGLVPSTAGALAALTMANLSPAWYPIALVITAVPCTWLGGFIHQKLHQ
jgi:hypothetical protein